MKNKKRSTACCAWAFRRGKHSVSAANRDFVPIAFKLNDRDDSHA